ncbi:MAG: ABC transporter ATP-binding protein [Acidimicrobiales bacterium]|nr:ABC transporter ATP-binding protein [Acidimicrobiales bacterium]
MTPPPAIRATGIGKAFGSTLAVDGADVTVPAGELVALLGPSGSGKTTMLRVIAGFERPDRGTVEVGGRLVAGDGVWEEPEQRRIGMVFQHGALFPHLTIAKNVGFGDPRPGRVEECLELVGLADRLDAYPHELSGGEQQRVALARALATEPDVVLLDEPFASLDATLRASLREEVAEILREAGASALLVTHDQQEALSLADQVVLMRRGRVEQVGPPEAVYDRPASRWVAEFLGAAEVFAGTAVHGEVATELGTFPADPALTGAVDVLVRPEAIVVDELHPPRAGCTCTGAQIVDRSFYGHDQLLRLELGSGRRLRSRSTGTARWNRGDDVRIRVEGPVQVLAHPSEE